VHRAAAPPPDRAAASTTPPRDVRASDADREAVVETLRVHAAAGRLDPEELEQRIEAVYAARLQSELPPLTADLPATRPAVAPPVRRRAVPDLAPLLLLAVALVAVWALTGAGYFWPMWPIGVLALHAVKHGRTASHDGRVAAPTS
jgi:hypothetical protein